MAFLPEFLRRLSGTDDGLRPVDVVVVVALLIVLCAGVVLGSQWLVEREPFGPPASALATPATRAQVEIAKLAAEVRQIRSDTSGSLFWLKLIALFVTVGGAIGGYLIAQDWATRARLRFEDRKNIDAAFQGLVKELADPAPVLRAAAAVKLGDILCAFPVEWKVDKDRQDQLQDLAKKVLAAALAIEEQPKVRKVLSGAITEHRPLEMGKEPGLSNMRKLDLSGAHADDAYWARADLTFADLYRAQLTGASLRKSVLHGTQFREASLVRAVLASADATGASFKMADLRHADFTGARLAGADFQGAKLFGAVFAGASFGSGVEALVDLSEQGDGTAMRPLSACIPGPTAAPDGSAGSALG